MARILVHVEGQTEEGFVTGVLAEHLLKFNHTVSARLLGNARLRAQRGGIRGWDTVCNDIIKHLTGDPGCYVTTMVDYYALPASGNKSWPGRAQAARMDFAARAPTIEAALSADMASRMDANFNNNRFIPYVVMHEFEGLLFSDCQRFAEGITRPELAPRLQSIRNAFTTPEEINDSPQTAPSKRVIDLFPGYQKPLLGNLAAREIGLDALLKECPFFRQWVHRLASLP